MTGRNTAQLSTRLTATLFAFSAMVVLPGCLVTSGRTVRETGPQISESALRAIEYDKTTTEWLVAVFGEPANRVCLPDGAEVLRYDSDIRTTEGSYFLMLAASSANKIERTCWWFETRDGKVVRAWGENCDPITVDSLNPPPPNDRAIGVTVPTATVRAGSESSPTTLSAPAPANARGPDAPPQNNPVDAASPTHEASPE